MDSPIPGYSLIRQIGTGAGSRIYVAREEASGVMRAIKRVPRNSPEDDRFLKQVEVEFEVSHKLDHRYLRHSFLLHRVRKRLTTRELCMVMEYVDGPTVEQALPNRLKTFLALFTRVSSALDFMHDNGYVHSDIKPNNIMVGQGGVVKVIDFGQSCPMGQRKERVQGTPEYISPEQVKKMPLDRRTDVYNLGATMYWVLTTQHFPTPMQRLDVPRGMKIKREEPVAPIRINDKIPVALSNLVMECCREQPDDRPSDLKQVRSRLEAIEKRWREHLSNLKAEGKGEGDSDESDEPSTAENIE